MKKQAHPEQVYRLLKQGILPRTMKNIYLAIRKLLSQYLVNN